MANIDTNADLLAKIRQRESGGRYDLPPTANYAYPASHASGAYQFQPGTWKLWTSRSGVGGEYPEAFLAPPNVQDAVAAFAATHADPNSSALWGASAPGGGYTGAVPDTSQPSTAEFFTQHLAKLQEEQAKLRAQQLALGQQNPAPRPLAFGMTSPLSAAVQQLAGAFGTGGTPTENIPAPIPRLLAGDALPVSRALS